MRQVRVGIRGTDDGLAFIGTEEVNELIAAGWRVTAVQPGDALSEVPGAESEDGGVAMALRGYINVQVTDSRS